MQSFDYQYDVLVIGGGHAGTEAALAAARMGARTALLTTNLDTVGQMSCNPAIGGVAKGQIAREVDALGGAMGLAIDRTGIQFRLLNRRKGPAMHSPRAQADKKAYQQEIKQIVENQQNLDLRQEIVLDLITEQTGEKTRIIGVSVTGNASYGAPAVILTTGTFMKAVMHTGESQTSGGRAGEGTSAGISGALNRLGFRVERFKTGTPPRLNARTIDYSLTEEQPGDDDPQPFSFLTDRITSEQLPCWITYTNAAAHRIILANLERAPMYSGQIKSSGPRYCPSIEDKVVRFAGRDAHQIFLEPEGRHTQEVYVNGISTSLPRDVQDALLREIPALRNAQVMRYGYAVEYDFLPPDQLQPSLESKPVAGLFLAGQINGTTGYEEAAAQGLIAGANAVLISSGRQPMVLGREEAYIGVLIDDLVTKGVDEPYRMFTSRAEYRLILRHDNADRRLTPLAHRLGLADANRLDLVQQKKRAIEQTIALLNETRWQDANLMKFFRQTATTWEELLPYLPALADVDDEVVRQVTHDIKYSGYVARQEAEIERQNRLGEKRIPETLRFASITQLRSEAKEKLDRIRPVSLAQASRISGITPADIALLLAHLEHGGMK